MPSVLFCGQCGAEFLTLALVAGVRLNLRGRKRCLACRPHRPLHGPRKPVVRPVLTKNCAACRSPFPAKSVIDGKIRSLYRRRFCLSCSPFNTHNTSTSPPGVALPEALAEIRRRRQNAKTYRYQKAQRKRVKEELVAARGGQCEGCGYRANIAALEFHHRDASSKKFAIGGASVSRERLWAEAAKCDLLCANCHRARHSRVRTGGGHAVVLLRHRLKVRAVAAIGGRCSGCGLREPIEALEFHHLDPATKEFGISTDGIARRWDKIEAELAKCVLLCANCHREVHAGARLVSEDEGPYRSCAIAADPLHKRCA